MTNMDSTIALRNNLTTPQTAELTQTNQVSEVEENLFGDNAQTTTDTNALVNELSQNPAFIAIIQTIVQTVVTTVMSTLTEFLGGTSLNNQTSQSGQTTQANGANQTSQSEQPTASNEIKPTTQTTIEEKPVQAESKVENPAAEEAKQMLNESAPSPIVGSYTSERYKCLEAAVNSDDPELSSLYVEYVKSMDLAFSRSALTVKHSTGYAKGKLMQQIQAKLAQQ